MERQAAMNCPACGKPLASERYEGFPLWHCAGCGGRLVEKARLDAIEEKRGLSTDELTREAEDERRADTAGPVACPKCSKAMSKEGVPGPIRFDIDVCGKCGLVWLDGGELALLQLAYEASQQEEMSAELTRRLEDLAPGDRKRLDDTLSVLREGLVPDGPDLGAYGFMLTIFGEGPML